MQLKLILKRHCCLGNSSSAWVIKYLTRLCAGRLGAGTVFFGVACFLEAEWCHAQQWWGRGERRRRRWWRIRRWRIRRWRWRRWRRWWFPPALWWKQPVTRVPLFPRPTTCSSITRRLAPDWPSRVIVTEQRGGVEKDDTMGGPDSGGKFISCWSGSLVLRWESVAEWTAGRKKETHVVRSVASRSLDYTELAGCSVFTGYMCNVHRCRPVVFACTLLVFISHL